MERIDQDSVATVEQTDASNANMLDQCDDNKTSVTDMCATQHVTQTDNAVQHADSNARNTDTVKETGAEEKSSEENNESDHSEESLLDCQDEHCEGIEDGHPGDLHQGPKVSATADYFCTSCDLLLCTPCQFKYHKDHELALISEARKAKEKYIGELLHGVNANTVKCQTQKLQLENLVSYLNKSAKEIILRIESRAAKLCEEVQKRKQQLLDEVRALKKYHLSQYENQLKMVDALKKDLDEASDFASTLLSHGEDSDVLTLGRDVSDNLHKLIKKRGLNGVNISSMKLDVPDESHDGQHVDKLFGTLLQGVVRCGEADRVASYNIDLPWPTGMAVTRNHDFVVTGKMGALDEQGKVMFFNKQGKLQNVDNLEDNCVPYGACYDHKSGDVFVTDSKHRVTTYSPLGRKKKVVNGTFQGIGRPAVSGSAGHLVVTSSDDQKVFLYGGQGEKKFSFPTDGTRLDHPHYVAVSDLGDVIVSDFKQNAVLVFDAGGNLTFKYLGNGTEGGRLKCPSAVCCDTLGNILVADFMNDRVHLVSKTGDFLGFLLSKENGIACPNFMTLDHENNLYVGQYGGEISVFRYQSLVKYV